MGHMPRTIHGLDPFAVMSAMQKHIRRSEEVQAMLCACELLHTSKAFCTMTINRLRVISHEDIDAVANPWVVPFVETACKQAGELYAKNTENPGKTRMFIGNAIRLMCDAVKGRIGDHFQCAIGWANLYEGRVPEIPDWTKDKHTLEGRKMGRGLVHFREVAAKLVEHNGKEVIEDEYANDAYRLWSRFADDGNKPAAAVEGGSPAQVRMNLGH